MSANSVAVVIGDIRRALDDPARSPLYIETVPKRGYRLRNGPPVHPPEEAVRVGRGAPVASRRWLVTGVFVAAAGACAASGLALRNHVKRLDVVLSPVRNDTADPSQDRLARALDLLVAEQLAAVPGLALQRGEAVRRTGLVLQSRLILWNDRVTLSLEALTLPAQTIVWAGMAQGPSSALAGNTVAQLRSFSAALRRQHLAS